MHLRQSARSPRLRPALRVLVSCCCLASGFVSVRAGGQTYDSWSKVEAAEETRDYGQQIRDGKFDAAQEAFVTKLVLPQLALPANRGSIVQVRQRIRDLLTRGSTAPKIFDTANTLARDFTVTLARDAAAEPIVRINAVLLLADLQSVDRKPWGGGLEQLAALAADATLPLAVRIAAVVGLSRHQADTAAAEAFSKTAGPALATIVTKPPQGDPQGVAWFVGRAVDLLPPPAAGPAVIKALAGILATEGADLDLRIRAAAALGRSKLPAGAIDQAALGHVRTLAVTALERDLAAAEARRFSRLIGGGQGLPGAPIGAGEAVSRPPPGQFGGEGLFGGLSGEEGASDHDDDKDGMPTEVCRRDAWRLWALAEAVKPDGSATVGLAAALKGDAAAEALDLATTLREQAGAIHDSPTEESVKAALAALAKDRDRPDPPKGLPAGTSGDGAAPAADPAPASAF